ncbi:MAG: hypothetical protein Q8Q09_29160 [Deltaproteobacteria bacterium]|nr:hypothetical protein [Deltaproteobacteria bacterium]
MEYELEEIAGATCVHSKQKILVATDGTNCSKCGRAVLRKNSEEHESGCSGSGAIARVKHDYDELAPIVWTQQLIALVALGVFLAAFGGGLMMATPQNAPGELPKPMSTNKLLTGFALLAVGASVSALSYARARASQSKR